MGEKEKEEKRWKKGNKTKGEIFGNPKKREKRKSKKKKEGKWGVGNKRKSEKKHNIKMKRKTKQKGG
jgi:hypothetical protein